MPKSNPGTPIVSSPPTPGTPGGSAYMGPDGSEARRNARLRERRELRRRQQAQAAPTEPTPTPQQVTVEIYGPSISVWYALLLLSAVGGWSFLVVNGRELLTWLRQLSY